MTHATKYLTKYLLFLSKLEKSTKGLKKGSTFIHDFNDVAHLQYWRQVQNCHYA